jgi:hypothetical protein
MSKGRIVMLGHTNRQQRIGAVPLRGWRLLSLACFWGFMLSGCDQIGIDTPATIQARAEQEGKAVGTACRHAMRAIEDCYTMNPKTPKSAIAAGWREMDEYMRENSIEGVAPALGKALATKQNDGGEEEVATESAGTPH